MHRLHLHTNYMYKNHYGTQNSKCIDCMRIDGRRDGGAGEEREVTRENREKVEGREKPN